MPLPRYNTTLGNRRSSQRRRTALVVRLSDFSTSMVLLLTVGYKYSVRLIYAAIKSANDNKQIIIESSNLKNTNEQILKILAAANIKQLTSIDAKMLPTWEDITSMYGDKPVIRGLETCEQYRNMVHPADRTIGPAGLFNTGTNLLWKLMRDNCNIDGEVLWQAPWGKHALPSSRLKRVAWDGEREGGSIRLSSSHT